MNIGSKNKEYHNKINKYITFRPEVTLLYRSVELNNCAAIETLLHHPHIDVNRGSYQGMTPLMVAIETDRMELFKRLLEHPAIDVNRATKVYIGGGEMTGFRGAETVLWKAIYYGKVE
jgi:ankyrin repeat protein